MAVKISDASYINVKQPVDISDESRQVSEEQEFSSYMNTKERERKYQAVQKNTFEPSGNYTDLSCRIIPSELIGITAEGCIRMPQASVKRINYTDILPSNKSNCLNKCPSDLREVNCKQMSDASDKNSNNCTQKKVSKRPPLVKPKPKRIPLTEAKQETVTNHPAIKMFSTWRCTYILLLGLLLLILVVISVAAIAITITRLHCEYDRSSCTIYPIIVQGDPYPYLLNNTCETYAKKKTIRSSKVCFRDFTCTHQGYCNCY